MTFPLSRNVRIPWLATVRSNSACASCAVQPILPQTDLARVPHHVAAAISVAIVASSVPAEPASRTPRRPSPGDERTTVVGFCLECWQDSNRVERSEPQTDCLGTIPVRLPTLQNPNDNDLRQRGQFLIWPLKPASLLAIADNRDGAAAVYFVGFHSRASRNASAI
jgi:hypothetical protein